MSSNCEKGYSVGTLVKHEYYSGRISIGIVVGIEHSTDAIRSPRCYTVYIDDDFDRWCEWFLDGRIVNVASPRG